MPTQTFRFTKKAIAELSNTGSITTYHDTMSRGLKLMVRPSGTKTFVLYRKINGRPERIMLGRFPDLSIEQARAKADEYNSTIASGKNPADEKRNVRDEITFKELFELYLERYAKVHKRAWESDVNLYRRHCQPIAECKLSHIKTTDIRRIHAKLGSNNGIYVANRFLALVRSVFNRAIDWGLDCPNPVVKGIKKFKEQSRDRFLQADELPRLFKALEEEPNDIIRDYILISLFTGARRNNVLAMRWEEVNLERGTWTIPMTKNGESHTVPLVAPAIEVLKIRKERTKTPWVFPGFGASGHLVEPKKAWHRILERADIKNLRLHDLRRSLGSWQAATGASLSVIGKTLAHKNVNTTAIYARLNLDPVRKAMDKATEAMLEAAASPKK